MAYPSLVCKRQSLCAIAVGCPETAPLPFNELRVHDTAGNWWLTYTCDATLSTFLPAQSSLAPMTGAEFAELWMPMAGILLAGFIVRIFIRAVSE